MQCQQVVSARGWHRARQRSAFRLAVESPAAWAHSSCTKQQGHRRPGVVEPREVVELHGHADQQQPWGGACQAERAVAQAPRGSAGAFSTTGVDSALSAEPGRGRGEQSAGNGTPAARPECAPGRGPGSAPGWAGPGGLRAAGFHLRSAARLPSGSLPGHWASCAG